MDVTPMPGLSERELLEFLHEIECMEDALTEEETKVEEAEAEEQSWFESIKEQEQQATSERIANNAPSERAEIAQRMHAERKLLKTRIQRSAFDQSEIPLTDKLTNEDVKMLIEVLTEDLARLVEKSAVFIASRIKSLLLPLIPGPLRKAYRQYPESVKACQGFLYRASQEYGEGKTFFVKPDVPYFFEQGSEMEVLRQAVSPEIICALDRHVRDYHRKRERLFNKETSIASSIPKYGIHTYFTLLNHNVIWFSKLYLKKTGKPLKLVD